TLRQPILSGITQQPRPPAAAIDCQAAVLTFCGDPNAGNYWNQPADGVTSWAGVYTDAFGFVHLQGTVQRVGSTPLTIFVLPPAARPHADLFFMAMDGLLPTPKPVTIRIGSDGEVMELGNVAPNEYISLSGITFHP